ncbi:MAG TPA: zinc dependent phospholipase C family protein [Blastocatellia bacterium]|nr:zinc dependent phospholipase C family protein [Blastocatellia bacterium]
MTINLARKVTLSMAAVCLVLCLSSASFGYSVLTHQAIIDSTWEGHIKPLLLKRYPAANAEQLREAHAHAYGGAISQDMGYYPFGSRFYTDLTHYVRSGDFVEALVAESRDLNEYAFALGALAHYAADNHGHSIGTNRAVPLVYPEIRAKYGDEVTYAEDPSSHIKLEFAFDVLQVARGRYAPENYHDFIGFKVSKDVLARAFKRTYSLELKDVFGNLDLALGTFRRTVSTIIPEMTKVAWEMKEDEIEKATPGITREKFVYNLSRADYEKEWGKQYEKPGFFAKSMAYFFRVMPKVGPFKALDFRPPTPEAERFLMESFNATLDRYRGLLGSMQAGRLNLDNRDLDTGRPVRAGEYPLADEAYAKLVRKLADKKLEGVTPDVRENILAFFSNLDAPIAVKRDKDDWRKTLRAIEVLRSTEARAETVVNRDK